MSLDQDRRTLPITGTERQRQIVVDLGLLLANEVHTTEDQKRTWMMGEDGIDVMTGPHIFLGGVVSESAMVALTDIHERGCYAGDKVFRLDKRKVFECIHDKGELFEEWATVRAHNTTFGGRHGTASDVTLSGGDFTTPNTRTRHGGFFRPTLFGGTL